jgi:hypothetical protein
VSRQMCLLLTHKCSAIVLAGFVLAGVDLKLYLPENKSPPTVLARLYTSVCDFLFTSVYIQDRYIKQVEG